MKRNMMWLLFGMAIMGGGRAIAECITFHDDMPATVLPGQGCLHGFVPQPAFTTPPQGISQPVSP